MGSVAPMRVSSNTEVHIVGYLDRMLCHPHISTANLPLFRFVVYAQFFPDMLDVYINAISLETLKPINRQAIIVALSELKRARSWRPSSSSLRGEQYLAT